MTELTKEYFDSWVAANTVYIDQHFADQAILIQAQQATVIFNITLVIKNIFKIIIGLHNTCSGGNLWAGFPEGSNYYWSIGDVSYNSLQGGLNLGLQYAWDVSYSPSTGIQFGYTLGTKDESQYWGQAIEIDEQDDTAKTWRIKGWIATPFQDILCLLWFVGNCMSEYGDFIGTTYCPVNGQGQPAADLTKIGGFRDVSNNLDYLSKIVPEVLANWRAFSP